MTQLTSQTQALSVCPQSSRAHCSQPSHRNTTSKHRAVPGRYCAPHRGLHPTVTTAQRSLVLCHGFCPILDFSLPVMESFLLGRVVGLFLSAVETPAQPCEGQGKEAAPPPPHINSQGNRELWVNSPTFFPLKQSWRCLSVPILGVQNLGRQGGGSSLPAAVTHNAFQITVFLLVRSSSLLTGFCFLGSLSQQNATAKALLGPGGGGRGGHTELIPLLPSLQLIVQW